VGAEGDKCGFEKCGADKCAGTDPSNIIVDGPTYWKEQDGDCQATERCYPSYTTMSSGGGLLFGVVNIVGNFGTVFVDQAYWQSAIAAEPKATVTSPRR
jgi:hypothetical protein